MTTKKKGRGRPRKEKLLSAELTTSKTKEVFDIKTGYVTKIEEEESTFPKDFSVSIDNATLDGEVRIQMEGSSELRQSFLANAYLDNPKFREFINDVVIRAARTKANRISVELNSIVN